MSADKMFEELGYAKEDLTVSHRVIKYTKDSDIIKFYSRNIVFYLDEHTMGACYEDMDRFPKADITMQELQAINKKCKEMGWIREEN